MPALKPLPSLARVEANRANAARSTGPRTAEGKSRSRANALKHGLAGEGIALPTEDAAAVVERCVALQDQFQPATPLGAHYVGRIALATVRLDRAARHEAAALARQVAHAITDFDAARIAAADSAMDRLRQGDVRAAHRDLVRTPEGIAGLVDELLGLRRCLGLTEPLWSREHGVRLDACLGIAHDPIIPSRVEALTSATLGHADLLTRPEQDAIIASGRSEANWALGQLVGLIDREIAALRADDAALDRTAIDRDRLGAADRALFDPSPAAQLARRYEAAAAREVDRSLRRFREVEVEVKAPTPPNDVCPARDQTPNPPLGAADPVPAGQPIDKLATVGPNSGLLNYLTTVLGSIGSDSVGTVAGFDSGVGGANQG